MSNFSLSLKDAQDVAIMSPTGYINDLGAERLELTSEQYLGKGLRKIVINFSHVQFINTLGVSIFTGIVQKTMDHEGQLCFTNMKKIHRDIFETVGLIEHVRVFKDEKDALSYLSDRD
jgi:anti-anti-sigma factor